MEVTTAVVASVDSAEVDGVPKLNEEVVVVVADLLTGAKENGLGMLEAAGLLENTGVDVGVAASLV